MAGKKRKKNSKPRGSTSPQDKKINSVQQVIARPLFEREDDEVAEQRVIQEPKSEAKQVEGYYSNDDVTILLDALLKRDELERIRGGDEQDIVRHLETGESLRTMVLAPIAEDSEEAIGQLILDIDRAYRHNVEQILVPINIPTIHWYTIQLQLFQLLDWRSLEATVHDSLGIRKNSVVVNRLVAQGIIVAKHIEGNLPKIQEGESGAKNIYCGGYTSRLIANLVTYPSIIGEDAWGCPNNIDNVLRQEDVSVVSKYNSVNAGNFGRGDIALSKMLYAAQTMSLLRGFIAKEKEFKLLRELKKIYRSMPAGIKLRIKTLTIPEDPAKLAAFVRELHGSLPILKILFQTDKRGEIEKDAQGQLKLDSNLEIEQIYNIVVEFQKKCFEFERIGITESRDDGEQMEHKKSEDIEKSLDSFGSVLHQRQPPYKGNSPEAAASLFNAGVAYFEAGDNSKALDYHELALKMRQSLYEGEHTEIATSLYSMGSVCQNLGDYIKSLDYYERSLNMRLSLYEGNHPEIAASLQSVGDVYQKLEDIKKALYYYRRALNMRLSLYEGNHNDTANSFYKIGYVHGKLGDTKKALCYYKNALKMRQALYEGCHLKIATSLYSVGTTCHKLGNVEEALGYLKPALEMMQSLYEGDNAEVAIFLNAVGVVYLELGDYRRALDNLEPALDIMQSLYEGDNAKVVTSLYAVGAAYFKLRDYRRALDHLEPALNVMQLSYGGGRPEFATSFYSVGIAYYKLGYAEEAIGYLEAALEMRQSLYKGAHAEVATSLHSVGAVYNSLGNPIKALDYLKSALAMMKTLYDDDHDEVATCLYNLGAAYYKLDDDSKAIQYLKAALKMQKSLYNGDHPDIPNSLKAMSVVYKKIGKVKKSLDYQDRASAMTEALNRQKQEAEFKGKGTLSYVDTSYLEYYNSGIDRVLLLRLKGLGYNSNAIALRSRYFEEGLGSAAKLAGDIMITFSSGATRMVLAPLNLYNQHWLGLLFRNLGAVVEVIYMDPEQRAMLPSLRLELENSLSINGYESRFLEAMLAPQSYNNCGYEVIENFAYYLTGARATQEMAAYVHSLLVENSLLDPQEYGLKIEENNRLVGFLSNVAPISIRSIDVSPNAKIQTIHHNSDTAIEVNLLPAIKQFNRLLGKWLQDKLRKANAMLHKTTIGFKGLDFGVDSARLLHKPDPENAKRVALDASYLYSLYSGVNGYSAIVSGAEVAYQLHLGEYRKAFNTGASTLSTMALPYILAMGNRPYLGFAYVMWVAASTTYNSVMNLYSFALELSKAEATLESAVSYKELVEWLAASPLQSVYDFGAQATEYKLQINDMLFEKEKTLVKAQLQGEFGQKIFDYVYLPELLEKYALLNDVVKGLLPEGEAEALRSRPTIISYGSLHYDHCIRDKSFAESEVDMEHYYCANLELQTLDKVVVTGSGSLEIIEKL